MQILNELASVLITTSWQLADEINREVECQVKDLPRWEVIAESIEQRGLIVVVTTVDEAIELANLYAPEHLCLMVSRETTYIDKVNNAGSVFIGNNSTVVLGDYAAGPSHVLPTGGSASFFSSLSVREFLKEVHVLDYTKKALQEEAEILEKIASLEGMTNHIESVKKRLG